jgi:hypothetical protein
MTISLVQSASNTGTSLTALTVTLGAGVTTGNTVVVCYASAGTVADPTISGITLSGKSFTSVVADNNFSGYGDMEIWVLPNCPGGSKTISVSMTGGSGTAFTAAFALEFAGLQSVSPADKSSANNPSSASASWTSNATPATTHTTELCVGFVPCAAETATIPTITGPTSPWTNSSPVTGTFSGNGQAAIFSYQVINTEQAVTYSGTVSATCYSAPAVATFIAAAPPVYPLARAIQAKALPPRARGVFTGMAPGDTSSGTGQVQWNAGAPVKNPTSGPVFRQATSPIRSRIPQNRARGVFSGVAPGDTSYGTGQIQWNGGAPVQNPGGVFQRGTPVIATGTTSVTGTWPTGSTQTKGDLLVAVVGSYGSTSNVSSATPAGWAQVENNYNFSPPVWIGVYVKVAAGGDSAPVFTTTATGSTNIACVLYDLAHPSGYTPSVWTSGSNFGTGGPITATTNGDIPPGSFAVSGAICGQGTTAATTAWTPPDGWALGGDQTASLVSQLASYYQPFPQVANSLSCQFTHSRTSTIQAAALFVAAPPGGISVIATMGGNVYEGMGLSVKVLTGTAGNPTGISGTASGTTGHVSITPGATGSVIYGAVTDANGDTTLTPESGNTFILTVQDNYNTAAYGTFRSTSTTTSGTPVVMGTTSALTGGNVAAVEIEAAGTIAEYATGSFETVSATAGMTYALSVPYGSLLVAMLATEGAVGTATATVTDTYGLTWTQVVHSNSTSGDGYAGVWVALVPEAPSWWDAPIKAALPKQPSGIGAPRGRVGSNTGAPVQNPIPPLTGPVFYQATSPIRARIPREASSGGIAGSGSGGAICGAINGNGFGNGNGSKGAPVKNPTAGPVFLQRVTPVRFIIPPPHPRAGRIGSSFGAPIQNPIHGPPAHPLEGPVRARLPLQPLLRGRSAFNYGAPVQDPVAGPVFRQAVHPARAVIPQTFSKGRISFNPGAPVRNPASGPVFRQAVTPARIRPGLPPRGRIASNPGGTIRNPAHPAAVYPLQGPVRAKQEPKPGLIYVSAVVSLSDQYSASYSQYYGIPGFSSSYSTGRISANYGTPPQNPLPGPVFHQAAAPIRARIPQNAPRGRVASSKGAPVQNPAPSNIGPPFFPRQSIRARLPLQPLLHGRVASNAGSPVRNPAAGPAFRQAVHPVRTPVPQTFSKGRISAGKGAPLQNPTPGPVFRQAVTPARARITLPPRGRIASNAGTPFVPSTSGPVFYPFRFPARARIPQNAPRGRIERNLGAPVQNPAPGPVFRPAVHPSRAVIPQISPRGRVYSNPGAPVQNPAPPVTGAPFTGLRQAVRARYLNQVYVLGDPGLIYVDSRDGTP